MQQSYAKLCGVTETVEVVDLVEDSLRLNAGAFVRHGVTLQREFGEVPTINVDKHKVLQILVNLVRNAKYACDDSGAPTSGSAARGAGAARCARLGDRQRHRHCAGEHGKVVPHGFTTRAAGHGFGLHSGAIAGAGTRRTRCRAESEGAGRGAAFILELPLSPPPAARS